MNWIPLTTPEQLEDIRIKSKEKPQVIFKHSTRCSISSMALSRLERSESVSGIDFYYLDLIAYRNISAKIAEMFEVHHESPQILLIRNGECVFDESHYGITIEDVIANSN
jgi:bacillithiol system protein YtxJ